MGRSSREEARNVSLVALATATALLAFAAPLTGRSSSAGAAAAWSAVTSPLPAGGSSGELSGVSCTSPANCLAVGAFTGGSRKTLAVRWNGAKWSVIASPNPTGAISSQLSAISCRTTGSCFAVGTWQTKTATKTLVERWNGRALAIVASPNSSEGNSSALSTVSCPSETTCFAAGTLRNASGPRKTLIERWNGMIWSIVAHPKLSGGHRNLNGVSCASPASCFAVGTHSVTGGGDLSCEPELDCFAGTLTEQWVGTHWVLVSSPNGKFALQSTLAGVSCVSTKSCIAVGTASPEGLWGKMLTERWNGNEWSTVAGANPAGILGSSLYGVSCSSSTNCFAAGSYLSSGDRDRTLVEHYSGTTWSIAYRANVPASLSAISCSNANSCVAVGGTSIQRLGPPV
jgi:hypothetical protein